jgi:hypothetical protein
MSQISVLSTSDFSMRTENFKVPGDRNLCCLFPPLIWRWRFGRFGRRSG